MEQVNTEWLSACRDFIRIEGDQSVVEWIESLNLSITLVLPGSETLRIDVSSVKDELVTIVMDQQVDQRTLHFKIISAFDRLTRLIKNSLNDKYKEDCVGLYYTKIGRQSWRLECCSLFQLFKPMLEIEPALLD